MLNISAMAIKRYIAFCSSFSVFLLLPSKKEVKLYFEGKDALTKQRFVDVEDPIIQTALEADKGFGTYFDLSPEHIEVRTAPSVIPDEVIPFANAADAKEWINKNHNVSYKKLANKAQVIEQYNALGIKIKFLNE